MRALASISTRALSGSPAVFALAVENARKMSPEELPPSPPMRPTPSDTRVASRFS